MQLDKHRTQNLFLYLPVFVPYPRYLTTHRHNTARISRCLASFRAWHKFQSWTLQSINNVAVLIISKFIWTNIATSIRIRHTLTSVRRGVFAAACATLRSKSTTVIGEHCLAHRAHFRAYSSLFTVASKHTMFLGLLTSTTTPSSTLEIVSDKPQPA